MNTKQLADFLNRVNIHLKEKYGTDFVTLIQMGLTAEELLVCILQFNDLYQYIKDNNLNENNILSNMEESYEFIATEIYETRNKTLYSYVVKGVKDDGIYNENKYRK